MLPVTQAIGEKRLVWEQASKNLNAAPALVVLFFPICQTGEMIWKRAIIDIISWKFI